AGRHGLSAAGMCSQCHGFCERVKIPDPREYRNLAKQLVELVSSGQFKLLQGTCGLEELFGPTWPSDVISHEFACSDCGQRFHLSIDSYHGGGDWMTLGGAKTPKRVQ